MLSQTAEAKQLSRVKFHLDKLKDGTQLPVLWIDGKLFAAQAIQNNQNDRIYTERKEDIPLNERINHQCQTTASVMVWAGANSTGK